MTDAILAITGAGSSSLLLGLLATISCNIELTACSNKETLLTFISVIASLQLMIWARSLYAQYRLSGGTSDGGLT
jgi:hypothetical protein